MSIQVDHSILPTLIPSAFSRLHATPPVHAVYDLEYTRTGNVFTFTGLRWKDRLVHDSELTEGERRAVNRYIRRQVQPDCAGK